MPEFRTLLLLLCCCELMAYNDRKHIYIFKFYLYIPSYKLSNSLVGPGLILCRIVVKNLHHRIMASSLVCASFAVGPYVADHPRPFARYPLHSGSSSCCHKLLYLVQWRQKIEPFVAVSPTRKKSNPSALWGGQKPAVRNLARTSAFSY